jgi:CelD/BcsL family acetyltransferase involved in cellulose biosynthesis
LNGGSAPNQPPRSLHLDPLPDLDVAREEWDELAEQTGNVFSTWEWHSLWWRHFGSSRTLLATACRSSTGQLVAILPLYLWRGRPLRIVRLVGHHVGDQLGPIYRPGDLRAVSDALRAALSRFEADIFLGEHMPAEEEWASLRGAKALKHDASPTLHVDGASWDEFLASCSSNARSQIRARERRLARRHDIRFRLTASPLELQNDLNTLFALHKLRWGRQATTFATYESFHRDFAASALDRGWLRLWFLEIDGQPRACWYGFRYAGIQSFYQAGRDPAWDRSSVGSVVLMHSIRDAFADGMSEYRFLRGDEPYKYRFATSDRGVETIAIARGLASRAALAAAGVAQRSRLLKDVVSP